MVLSSCVQPISIHYRHHLVDRQLARMTPLARLGVAQNFHSAGSWRSSSHRLSWRRTHPRLRSECTHCTSAVAGQRRFEPVLPLVLAWNAAQNQSVFAAQCFVESVIKFVQEGSASPFDELKTELKLANLGGRMLDTGDAMAEDVLVTWLAIICLTLSEIGVSPGAQEAEQSPYLQGMAGMVKQNIKQYDDGYTLQSISAIQALARQGEGGQPPSPFIVLMQQYTRLVLLTLEVAAALRLPCNRRLDNPVSLAAPSGYVDGFVQPVAAASAPAAAAAAAAPPAVSGQQDGGGEAEAEAAAMRGLVVRALICFNGAVLGSSFSMQHLVQALADGYVRGLTASNVLSCVRDEELQQSGGLLLVGPPGQQEAARAQVNKQLFATWVSLSYFVLAQLGVPHPAAAAGREGWAWAAVSQGEDISTATGGDGDDSGMAAAAMAFFVERALGRIAAEVAQQEAEAAASADAGDDDATSSSDGLDTVPALASSDEDPLLKRFKQVPEAAAALEQSLKRLAEQAEFLPSLAKVEDPEVGATSSAAVAWQQQLNLLRCTYLYVRRQQQIVAASQSPH